jgi:hypothetical protein
VCVAFIFVAMFLVDVCGLKKRGSKSENHPQAPSLIPLSPFFF